MPTADEAGTEELAALRGRCPVAHDRPGQRRADRSVPAAPLGWYVDADGTWHISRYTLARQALLSPHTRQAGFKAELIERVPGKNAPVLFLEGEKHHEQRRLTAPFFTPRTVDRRYRALMERQADTTIARLVASGRADLSETGMQMAVAVAAEVVGLTDSLFPGLDRRINAFFAHRPARPDAGVARAWEAMVAQWNLLKFHLIDVLPAIRKRRKAPREDVISHLLSQGYSSSEILIECITYGAAGMVTTREFISMCAWHLLDDPALRARYLAADENARLSLLEEILRLEPVVGNIFRRTTEAVALGEGDEAISIPAGALISIDVAAANSDPSAVGEAPLVIDPARECPNVRARGAALSFGDGHHRCPGAPLALQETDIFLTRLLKLDGLRLVDPPLVDWNELVTGYELRRCIVTIDRQAAGRPSTAQQS